AVLTACRLAKIGRAPVATYTFGAPRVGDLEFCDGYALPTYRIVNCLDLVPEMPLPTLKPVLAKKPELAKHKLLRGIRRAIDRAPCYGHVKTFVYIDRDGEIIEDAEVEP